MVSRIFLKDTILAPITPPGVGAVAIIRISGPDSYAAIQKYFRPNAHLSSLVSHRLYYGVLIDDPGNLIDEVMVVYMSAPHSYTSEDVVEIHTHGSPVIIDKTLRLFQQYGLRIAEPGEFTYRAYINGRIDLSQAEAVSALIFSQSESAHKVALNHANGNLRRIINQLILLVKQTLVPLEAWIDFPEEDLPREIRRPLATHIQQAVQLISQMLSTHKAGRILAEGISVILIGQPNVGKSSLLNFFLEEERAIVTDLPGTTRDLIEEIFTIQGIPVRLVDTAGFRLTNDPVEQEGMKRAQAKLQTADLVLLLIDGSKEFDDNDRFALSQSVDLPTIIVITKNDLTQRLIIESEYIDKPVFSVSVKSGSGVDKLLNGIYNLLLVDQQITNESVFITSNRHYEALSKTKTNLLQFLDLFQNNASFEFLAIELRDALFYLGQITGQTTTEDILDDIFSNFCIGK